MLQRTCSVNDVSHSPGRLILGMCSKHYRRYRKFGTTDKLKTSRKSYDKTCAICGISFVAKSAAAKYCGSKCRVLARPGLPPLYCADCSKRIPNSKTSAPQGKARCSDCINGGRGYYIDERGGRWSHGGSAYSVGCRCSVCQDAQADAMRRYKKKVRVERGVSPSTLFKRHYRERTGVRYRMAPSDWIDPKVRVEIYERDGWVCHLCDDPVDCVADFNDDFAPSLDHLKPRSKGGSDDPKNLKTAHRLCNSRRRDDELEALEVV